MRTNHVQKASFTNTLISMDNVGGSVSERSQIITVLMGKEDKQVIREIAFQNSFRGI